MSPINRNEISALLDGELSKEREEQVLHAIAKDPALQHEYGLLAGLHTEWLATAGGAGFCPDVSLPADRNTVPFSLPLFASVLLILRVAAKTVSPVTAFSLELMVLVLMMTWFLRTLIPACNPVPRTLG